MNFRWLNNVTLNYSRYISDINLVFLFGLTAGGGGGGGGEYIK